MPRRCSSYTFPGKYVSYRSVQDHDGISEMDFVFVFSYHDTIYEPWYYKRRAMSHSFSCSSGAFISIYSFFLFEKYVFDMCSNRVIPCQVSQVHHWVIGDSD